LTHGQQGGIKFLSLEQRNQKHVKAGEKQRGRVYTMNAVGNGQSSFTSIQDNDIEILNKMNKKKRQEDSSLCT
jgi:hypothetical protein